jgi:hypothetical protein
MSKYLNSRSNRFFHCGNCGEEVPMKAKACPECGADEATGLVGLEDDYTTEIPEDFNYDAFMKREFSVSRHLKPHHLSWGWWVVGLICLAMCILGVFALCTR